MAAGAVKSTVRTTTPAESSTRTDVSATLPLNRRYAASAVAIRSCVPPAATIERSAETDALYRALCRDSFANQLPRQPSGESIDTPAPLGVDRVSCVSTDTRSVKTLLLLAR